MGEVLDPKKWGDVHIRTLSLRSCLECCATPVNGQAARCSDNQGLASIGESESSQLEFNRQFVKDTGLFVSGAMQPRTRLYQK